MSRHGPWYSEFNLLLAAVLWAEYNPFEMLAAFYLILIVNLRNKIHFKHSLLIFGKIQTTIKYGGADCEFIICSKYCHFLNGLFGHMK